MSDLDVFKASAREFIERVLPTLPSPESEGEHAREEVSLFTSRAAELAQVPAARAWRAAKFDAGFGWLTGPAAYGGRDLPAEYEQRYNEIEAEYAVPDEDSLQRDRKSVV